MLLDACKLQRIGLAPHTAIDGSASSKREDAGAHLVTAPDEAGSANISDSAGPPLEDASGPDAAMDPLARRLTLEFRTVPGDGLYAPANCGVAWVEDEQGNWVHTFELWLGLAVFSKVKKYLAAGGPEYLSPLGSQAAPALAPPDVISSATFRNHKLHPSHGWDLKDANGNEVPDGKYSIVIEVLEDATDHAYEFPFEKSAQPFMSTPPDIGYIVDMKLNLE